MRMNRLPCAAAVAFSLSFSCIFARLSRADGTVVRIAQREPVFSGGLSLGIGLPSGWLGADLTFSPVDRLTVSGQVGLGTNGIQTAGLVHFYPFDSAIASDFRSVRTGFGVGLSTGTFAGRNDFVTNASVAYYRRAWFLNAELSLLAWHASHFGFEGVLGGMILLNPSDGVCIRRSPCGAFGAAPYLGLRFRLGS